MLGLSLMVLSVLKGKINKYLQLKIFKYLSWEFKNLGYLGKKNYKKCETFEERCIE